MVKLTFWQLLAALALLFAVILTAHRFVPGSVTVVVSMATTAFGALLLGLREQKPTAPPAEESGAQVIPFPSKKEDDAS